MHVKTVPKNVLKYMLKEIDANELFRQYEKLSFLILLKHLAFRIVKILFSPTIAVACFASQGILVKIPM